MAYLERKVRVKSPCDIAFKPNKTGNKARSTRGERDGPALRVCAGADDRGGCLRPRLALATEHLCSQRDRRQRDAGEGRRPRSEVTASFNGCKEQGERRCRHDNKEHQSIGSPPPWAQPQLRCSRLHPARPMLPTILPTRSRVRASSTSAASPPSSMAAPTWQARCTWTSAFRRSRRSRIPSSWSTAAPVPPPL